MEWRNRLKNGSFLKIVEVLPPKGTDVTRFEEQLIPLKGRVDAVYVPSLQGGVMRLSSWAACRYLLDRGYEAICEISCAHQNRVAIQAELLGVYHMGIENIMAVAGDDPQLGDHPEAKAVFDINVLELLGGIRNIQEGHDMSGGDLTGSHRFCVGTTLDASVRGRDLDAAMKAMEEAIGLGAEFFITTSVYDLAQFEAFMQKARTFGVPVIAGVMVLKSAGMVRYINKHVAGVVVPETIIERLMKAPDKIAASIEIAAEMIKGIAGLCQGVNIISMGWEDRVPVILDAAEG
jgi:methylenetetrahydrofolate reductase (NADPH)